MRAVYRVSKYWPILSLQVPTQLAQRAQVYLHRVAKAVHPELSVSKRSMEVLQSFSADMFERLVAEAARITQRTGRQTLSSREVRQPSIGAANACIARHTHKAAYKAITL